MEMQKMLSAFLKIEFKAPAIADSSTACILEEVFEMMELMAETLAPVESALLAHVAAARSTQGALEAALAARKHAQAAMQVVVEAQGGSLGLTKADDLLKQVSTV